MRQWTYAVGATLMALAACSMEENDPGGSEPVTPEDGTAPLLDASIDTPDTIDANEERPLVCGDAGFCETRLPKSDTGLPLPLRAVWAASGNDVWTVSADGAVLHYDGTSWTTDYRAHHELYAVWATSTSVWVGGEGGLLLHRTAGGDWLRFEAGHVRPIRSIYGTSDDDVWFTRGDGSIDHFDGTSLTSRSIDIPGLEVTTVFGRPGFGAYATGFVAGEPAPDPGPQSFPDQPYVFELSLAQISIFSTAFAETRGFMPIAGVVTDSPDPSKRVFVAGYERAHFVADKEYFQYYTKYAFVGSTTIVAPEPLTFGNPRLIPDWGIAALAPRWDDIRLVTDWGSVARWNGESFSRESLAMGYDVPRTTVFGAHGNVGYAWVVGDGFALKGATK